MGLNAEWYFGCIWVVVFKVIKPLWILLLFSQWNLLAILTCKVGQKLTHTKYVSSRFQLLLFELYYHVFAPVFPTKVAKPQTTKL